VVVQDKGTTQVRDYVKLSRTRPYVVNEQEYIAAKKSVFNKVVGDNTFELEFAAFLENCTNIISFAKNYQHQNTAFSIEYQTAEGDIRSYYPDFIVKQSASDIWIIETKGREDIQDARKWERLRQWCEDASATGGGCKYRALFVREEECETYRPKSFRELVAATETN
jgi:type III restriction enzyme